MFQKLEPSRVSIWTRLFSFPWGVLNLYILPCPSYNHIFVSTYRYSLEICSKIFWLQIHFEPKLLKTIEKSLLFMGWKRIIMKFLRSYRITCMRTIFWVVLYEECFELRHNSKYLEYGGIISRSILWTLVNLLILFAKNPTTILLDCFQNLTRSISIPQWHYSNPPPRTDVFDLKFWP